MDQTAPHLPVLRDEVVQLLSPRPRALIVDCTAGLGGHAESLLEAAPESILLGCDLDEANLKLAQERLKRYGPRVRLFHANFSHVPQVLREAGIAKADAILADLGVSSSQLDDPARGLSFLREGPLDMRLDKSQRTTAADLIRETSEADLADMIYQYGEDRYSRRIARAIVGQRTTGRIETTTQLAEIIAGALPAAVRHSRTGVHPATRTFQALRIAVNDEIENLRTLLSLLPGLLNPMGRAAIISFHSLEDREVKQAFRGWAAQGRARLLTKKPIVARNEEISVNPRSRSAKLRGVENLL